MTSVATTTLISKLARALTLVCSLFVASCGLIADHQDDQDKEIFISFPDPAFERACVAACDLDADGRVSRYEALRLLNLSCPNSGITSIDGVGEFKRLRRFDCSGNQIVSVDLARNMELETLNCSNNYITHLNIKGLYYLYELRCADNRLSLLDLVGESSLSTIDCARNRLTTLDVTTCAREIAVLNTRGNESLGVIYVSSLQRVADLQVDGITQIVVER